MASTSSINSSSSGSQAPNPPPRTHSRPNQPPPPPPLPTVPPVPPTRDSSINISLKVSKHSPNPPIGHQNHGAKGVAPSGERFLNQYGSLFKPLEDLPPPEAFKNKPKSYPSHRAQQKQSNVSKIESC